MKTNTQFTVMVHVLTLLATADEPLSSAWIAKSVNTNPVVIRQVMAPLRNAGLVETIPGSAGGARLAQPAHKITLANVYALVRKASLFAMHASEPSPLCPVGRNIQDTLSGVYCHLDAIITDALAEITIANILEQVRANDVAQKDNNA